MQSCGCERKRDEETHSLSMHAAGTGAERSDSAMQVAMRPLPNENEINMAFV